MQTKKQKTSPATHMGANACGDANKKTEHFFSNTQGGQFLW
jgi:hypothetical protein